MTGCSALGCREPATDTRPITMTDGRIVEAHWCKAHADAYDIALRDIEAWGARENARMDREADERRRMYGG